MLDCYYIDKRKIKKDLVRQVKNLLRKKRKNTPYEMAHAIKTRYDVNASIRYLCKIKKDIIKGNYIIKLYSKMQITCKVGHTIFHVFNTKYPDISG